MKATGAQLVVRALEDEDIPFAFGIPGTHNIELYDALAASARVRPVLVTDEQSASFMADGMWRASGRLGCVNVVPGAGLTHALSGIAEAFMDNVPMLVLGCGIRLDTGKAYQLHDVDQAAIVRPVVKGTFRPERGEEIYPTIRRSCRLARDGAPGPVFVEIPANLYLFRHDAGDLAAAALAPLAPSLPAPDQVRRAAQLLRESRRTLLYVGAGAAGAAADVLALAEALEAPVSTTFQGKGVFPESHPLFLWPGFGDSAPPFVREIAGECDLTLAIGCRFSEVGTGSYGLKPPGLLVHVDVDPEVPGRNYEAGLPVVADAGAFLRRLREAAADIRRGPDAGLRRRIAEGHEAVRAEWLGKGNEAGSSGVDPARLLHALQTRLGPDAVFTTDSGNGTFLAMECLRLDGPRRFLAPVDYSCMGYAVPAALGAALGRPDRPVVALAGDGAFLMTGLELLTGVREGLGVLVVVLRDRELAQIAQFQATALNRKTSSDVPDYALEPLARALGVPYLSLDANARVEAVVDEAAALVGEGCPVLVEAAVDYSRRTWFTRGVVRTNLLRLPVKDRLRFVGRAAVRRITG